MFRQPVLRFLPTPSAAEKSQAAKLHGDVLVPPKPTAHVLRSEQPHAKPGGQHANPEGHHANTVHTAVEAFKSEFCACGSVAPPADVNKDGNVARAVAHQDSGAKLATGDPFQDCTGCAGKGNELLDAWAEPTQQDAYTKVASALPACKHRNKEVAYDQSEAADTRSWLKARLSKSVQLPQAQQKCNFNQPLPQGTCRVDPTDAIASAAVAPKQDSPSCRLASNCTKSDKVQQQPDGPPGVVCRTFPSSMRLLAVLGKVVIFMQIHPFIRSGHECKMQV